MNKDDAGQNWSASAGVWNVLAVVGGMIPGVTPVAQGFARSTVQRLLGFWLMWQLFGGRQGLFDAGAISHSTCYRQENEFRRVFGAEVGDWAPGLAAALKGAGGEQG